MILLRKFSQNLLVFVFLATIFAPVIIMLTTESNTFSSHEKRRLATAPQWRWDSSLLSAYPDQFTRYFDDHYGLREKLIARNQHLKQKYLNKSPTWMVVRGEQGWLFMDKKNALRDHLGLENVDQQTLSNWQQYLLDKQAWLRDLGIDYLFVPLPNKLTLYSEFLPKQMHEDAGETRLDQLLAYLHKQDRFGAYTNLEPVLKSYQQAHPEETLYFKTDTHWTSLGAFVAYRHIMTRLQAQQPRLGDSLTLQDLQSKPIIKKGDLASIININQPDRERSYELRPRTPCAAQNNALLPGFNRKESKQKQGKKPPVVNGCANKHLSAVIVHDSFGLYLQPFFSESFKRVVYLQDSKPAELLDLLKNERPDIYLDLKIERNLPALFKSRMWPW